MWYWSADNLFWQVSIDHSTGCPISKKYTVNQGCMSMSTYLLDYGRHVARLRRRRRRRRAYAPTSNTASHDNHKKILHGFPFLSRDDYGAPLGGPSGRRSSAINRRSQGSLWYASAKLLDGHHFFCFCKQLALGWLGDGLYGESFRAKWSFSESWRKPYIYTFIHTLFDE